VGLGGDVLADWKVIELVVVVVPGAKMVELVATVGRVIVAGSDWLVGGAEDGEIPDCCMICAIVGGAEKDVRETGQKRGSCRLIDSTDLLPSLPFWRLE
jgi:hypothetical protein